MEKIATRAICAGHLASYYHYNVFLNKMLHILVVVAALIAWDSDWQ